MEKQVELLARQGMNPGQIAARLGLQPQDILTKYHKAFQEGCGFALTEPEKQFSDYLGSLSPEEKALQEAKEAEAKRLAELEVKKERKRAYRREYYRKNKERLDAMNRASRNRRKDKINEERRKYRLEHLEEERRKGREYYQKNRERLRANNKAYRERNKEKLQAYLEATREHRNKLARDNLARHKAEVPSDTNWMFPNIYYRQLSNSRNYYWKNRDEVRRKARERYRKKKALSAGPQHPITESKYEWMTSKE